jgi:hypothetical protein
MAEAIGLAYYPVVYYTVTWPGETPMRLLFVETTVFTRRIAALGLDADLRQLQAKLLAHPETGATDAGTGGLRKVRMGAAARGQGKRGGARVHYLWLPAHEVIYLVFVYGKHERGQLDAHQKRQVKAVVEQIRQEWG